MQYQYQVVIANSLGQIALKVEVAMRDDWKCQGGVTVTQFANGSIEYAQAMTKGVTE